MNTEESYINEYLKGIVSNLPESPGIYQYLNAEGIIIYVGKAKDLNKRLSSYFNRIHTGKTAKMVSLIEDFQYIVAASELEAFIIEINLIKEFNPKYNIMLTDDKSYPYIEYISSPYPMLKVSRYLNIKKKDNKKLFGPYPNAYAARRIVNLLNRLYPLKKCEGNPKDVCLYYHIGECLGYCSKLVDTNKVQEMENEILSFLRGNDKVLRDKIMDNIYRYSEAMNYEMALELKKELEYIDVIMDKQKVELHDFVNRDVWSYYINNGYLSIETLFIRNGKLLNHKNVIYPLSLDIEDELESYIVRFYGRNEIPKEILIHEGISLENLSNMVDSSFIIPLKGVKKDLIKMATDNAKINLENKFAEIVKDEERTTDANNELGKLLGIDDLTRIDVFDNISVAYYRGDNSYVSCYIFDNEGVSFCYILIPNERFLWNDIYTIEVEDISPPYTHMYSITLVFFYASVFCLKGNDSIKRRFFENVHIRKSFRTKNLLEKYWDGTITGYFFDDAKKWINKRRAKKQAYVNTHFTDEIVKMEREIRADAREWLKPVLAQAKQNNLDVKLKYYYVTKDSKELKSRPQEGYTYSIDVEISHYNEIDENKIIVISADLLYVKFGKTSYRGIKNQKAKEELQIDFSDVLEKIN